MNFLDRIRDKNDPNTAKPSVPKESTAVPPERFVVPPKPQPVASPANLPPTLAGRGSANSGCSTASPNAAPIALTRFEQACHYVMENEDGVRWDHDSGEYTNDPRDPGGATKWGVIKTEYETHLGRKLTLDEVKAMPRETAMEIYKEHFWDLILGDSYDSDSAATAIMDTAVNKGLGGCLVILTDALHSRVGGYSVSTVSLVDGIEEQKFLAAMDSATLRYIDRRIEEYPKMQWARDGWQNRANRIPTIPHFLAAL